MTYRVELHPPDRTKKLNPRNVKNLADWSLRIAKDLDPGTVMVVHKVKGTIQYKLTATRGWKLLRETFGP